MTSYTPPRLPLPPTFNNIYFLETNFLTKGEASDTYLPKSFPIFTGSIRGSDGSAITPAYTFSSKPDTGIYLGSVHHINFTSLGVQRMHVADDHIRAYHPLRLSADSPALTFQSDQNTGISNPSADVLNILTNGIERSRFSNSGVRIGVSGSDIPTLRYGSAVNSGSTSYSPSFGFTFTAAPHIQCVLARNDTSNQFIIQLLSVGTTSFTYRLVVTSIANPSQTYAGTDSHTIYWTAIGS